MHSTIGPNSQWLVVRLDVRYNIFYTNIGQALHKVNTTNYDINILTKFIAFTMWINICTTYINY